MYIDKSNYILKINVSIDKFIKNRNVAKVCLYYFIF